MRSNKRYSNVTVTKRVDHDAGRHRTKRARSEPAKCASCGAFYVKRRWIPAHSIKEPGKDAPWQPAPLTLCPACKQKQEGDIRGFVYLDGDFLGVHREEIERFINNEASHAAEDNPLGMIVKLETGEGGRVIVSTTTVHLAQRLGHGLQKAFGGKVHFDFSHENQLGRVYWRRD